MNTVSDMLQMPIEERKLFLQYEGWNPYCLMCNYPGRMRPQPYGWQCPQCKNMIGHHRQRLQESPLNEPGYTAPGLYPIPTP